MPAARTRLDTAQLLASLAHLHEAASSQPSSSRTSTFVGAHSQLRRQTPAIRSSPYDSMRTRLRAQLAATSSTKPFSIAVRHTKPRLHRRDDTRTRELRTGRKSNVVNASRATCTVRDPPSFALSAQDKPLRFDDLARSPDKPTQLRILSWPTHGPTARPARSPRVASRRVPLTAPQSQSWLERSAFRCRLQGLAVRRRNALSRFAKPLYAGSNPVLTSK